MVTPYDRLVDRLTPASARSITGSEWGKLYPAIELPVHRHSPPLVVAATGHRWEGLGVRRSIWADQRLEGLAHAFLQQLAPDAVISGMARGWDQAVARAALMLDLPLVAAVPAGQADRWSFADRHERDRLRARAAHVAVVGEGYPFARAADLRNRWMVDRAHLMLAMWNGSAGGTGNCLAYASRRKVSAVNLWGLQRAA